jgi:hypothetical protein
MKLALRALLPMIFLLVGAAAVEAQLSCGWCEESEAVTFCVWDPEGWGGGEWVCGEGQGHQFPNGADLCGSGGGGHHLQASAGPGETCARCGGTSSCHTEWDHGPCHIECGPGGGELLAMAREVREAERRRDASALTGMIGTRGDVRLVIDDAMIEVGVSCESGVLRMVGLAIDPELVRQIRVLMPKRNTEPELVASGT